MHYNVCNNTLLERDFDPFLQKVVGYSLSNSNTHCISVTGLLVLQQNVAAAAAENIAPSPDSAVVSTSNHVDAGTTMPFANSREAFVGICS